MPRKTSQGIRSPLSEEARRNIALAVRAAAERKRLSSDLQPEKKERRRERSPHMKEPKKIEIEIIKMDDQKFSPGLFEPMHTGKRIDEFFSTKIGIPRATNYLVVGDPGVGKSTVSMDIISDLQDRGSSVLFVSAEMTRIDLYDYVKRYPKFGRLPILFLGEYLDSPRDVIESALEAGYDIVLIDSLTEVVEAVKESDGVPVTAAEKWIVDLMIRHNLGGNGKARNTTFLCIQQVTKGGVFVGSNRLKHNVTGMLELRFDEGGEKSYMTFTKNRRGCVGVRMGFSLKLSGDVQYEGYQSYEIKGGEKKRASGSDKSKTDSDEYSVFRRDMPEF
jgi:predicted ATP-dependent serine protease